LYSLVSVMKPFLAIALKRRNDQSDQKIEKN
jgi:hypothetical protein